MRHFFQFCPHPNQKIVLLTGAAGEIGTSLRQHLGDNYHFRCFDRVRVRDAKDAQVADVTNFKAVLKAMRGVDAVIHLAANPNVEQSWQDVYSSGIGGTYNVFEAARQAGVKQIIYASTNHVSGWREVQQEPQIKPEQPVRPDSLYAVGKAFGEALGQFFVDRYDLSVVCLRIGAFKTDPKLYQPNDRLLATWCSARDLAQLVKRSLEHENLGFQIFYAISGNTRRYWDISNAQALLGYEPQDNAEDLLTNESRQENQV
ncbi:NAD-dependent epimerase/dehydratase (plasmid) [Crinalium epipsammum PCC 9333]|uniref:NAD-dependent epimerase/dehydratase n=1 Tax=Crinalium epipsammum PCC 9333 TaxID=1173022 RepID=K9W767_9CYAN|nr:NAD(P)-dependent oxidoreductase [Crinalium epipsammum]AFZ15634.1 NAD-dependent epimerase/dehydratase [Crinalium epipsammum PCC 9333]